MEAYGMFGLMQKLKRLKQCLREWNAGSFGNIFDNVKRSEDKCKSAELQFDQTQCDQDLIQLKESQAQLLRSLAEEELFWKQKSGIRWLKEGDGNTKFFHATLLSKRSRLHISRIKNMEGNWVEDEKGIEDAAVQFYSQLLSKPTEPTQTATVENILSSVPCLITDSQNIELLKPIQMDEVRTAVFSLDPESAPGSDGFSGDFFQRCWEIVATDVYKAVQEFFAGVPLPKCIGSTLVTLLPKKQVPSSFSDFRPISLCTFANKILTKVLSERLKKILHLVISDEQSAFVSGRDINDNILMAQELVQSLDKKARGSNVIFKLDMMKAFDRVSWDFLAGLLKKMGFHDHFVFLILNNLRGARFAILINGKSAGFFPASRGIKQGDPLSPYLFILLSEALSRGLNGLLAAGRMEQYALPRGCLPISHLSFADDIVIFTRGTRKSITALFQFLANYEEASGQKINKDKSFFVASRHLSSSQAFVVSSLSGIRKDELPFIYLGCMLFKGRPKSSYFQHVLDKLDVKLQGWQQRLLSPGGRLILIKHVLTSIPLYFFGSLQPPANIIARIERKLSNFYWGQAEDQAKRHWRSWDKIARPVEENGLGVKSLHGLISASSCKLWWKYLQGQGLWSKFLKSRKEGLTHGFQWRRMKSVEEVVGNNVTVKIRNGSCSFWNDNWTGRGPLREYSLDNEDFPYAIRVCDVYENGRWTMEFLEAFLNPEAVQFVSSIQLQLIEGDDQFFWQPSSSGCFEFSSAYNLTRPRGVVRQQLNFIWRKRLELKVSIFMWRLLNSIIPLPDVLMRLGFSMPSKCLFCDAVEDTNHLFLECPYSVKVWEFFLSKLNMHRMQANTLWDWLDLWWYYDDSRSAIQEVRILLPSIVCWEIWKARNKAFFDGQNFQVSYLIRQVFNKLRAMELSWPFLVSGDNDMILVHNGLLSSLKKRPPPSVVITYWSSPSDGWMKLNVDGSSLGNPGPSGIGFVIRDSHGGLVRAAADYVGEMTNLLAEFTALKIGIQHCLHLGLPRICVQSDSALLVSIIRGDALCPWKYLDLLAEVQRMLLCTEYTIEHIYRESNSFADALAKMSSTTKQSYSFLLSTQLPKRLQGLLALDQRHFPYIRINRKRM